MSTDIKDILAERGQRYGKFLSHAEVTMQLKAVIRSFCAEMDRKLEYDQEEALDMICHKIGRIVNGDPNYVDSWDDIAGYATLVAERLRNDNTPF